MKTPVWVAALLFVVLVVSAPLAAHSGLDLETSHSGAVTDLVFDGRRGLLFSAGEDGTIRIWETAQGRLRGVLRVSYEPIQKITIHPTLPQVAAIVGGSLRSVTLAVWDWERPGQLYSLDFKEQLFSLQYSPGGSYLVATRADFDSLLLLDPKTGRSLYYMRKGLGIVSFAVVSGNENNIMTYQPSGVITYWDVRSGRTLKEVSTLADLSLFTVSPNNRFAAAAFKDRLVVVDLVTGERIDERRVPGLTALAFSPQGNELAGIVRTAAGVELQQWYFGGRLLLQVTPPWKGDATVEPVSLTYGEGRLYSGQWDGSIVALRPDGAADILAKNLLLRQSDAAVLDDTIAVAAGNSILLIESEFLSTPSGMDPDGVLREEVPVSVRTLPNPLGASSGDNGPGVGVEFLDPRTLLVWTRGDEHPTLGLLDTGSDRFQPLALEFDAPLKQVSRFLQGIVIVDEGGQCMILDPFSFQPKFRYRSPGMNRLVFAVGDSLVGGRTSLSTFGSPLLQINQRTGETVAISDPGLFVYNLVFEARGPALYTVSVDSSSDPSRTLLKMHSGYGFERSRILAEYRGEDLSAGLIADSAGRVYSSLGFERVVVWDGERLERLEDARQIHRELHASGNKLVAVNRDGSFSFWDIPTRRFLLNLYLFEDATWLAVLPSGATYSSAPSALPTR